MLKRILVCGLSGGFVLFAWTIVLNVGFGFSHSVEMRRVANERDVYVVLKENVAQPGAYVVNPVPAPGVGFPPGEPVFSVQYGGIGHEAAGAMLLLELAIGFAAPVVVAALLSMAAASVLSRYLRKVLFVGMIGFAIAGRVVPEVDRPEIREVITRPYRVVYRYHGESVEIATVFRSSRQLPEIS